MQELRLATGTALMQFKHGAWREIVLPSDSGFGPWVVEFSVIIIILLFLSRLGLSGALLALVTTRKAYIARPWNYSWTNSGQTNMPGDGFANSEGPGP